MRGTIVTLFNKGFGFIRVRGQKDHFFAAHALSPLTVGFANLEPGDLVTFESIEHPKGLRAVNVSLLAKAGDHVTKEKSEDG